MDEVNIISDIINIPTRFYNPGDISVYSLLRNTGYFEVFDEINENKILQQLIKNPEWIQQWLNYSDDKRTPSGWYFNKNEIGKYSVGYYPPTERFKTYEFSDNREACAKFIKLEIEEIRK